MTPALDVLLSGSLSDASATAGSLDGAGVDGLFTYEGTGDVFFPLVQAAATTSSLLYTNVAIAIPRSPMHLAYQAWDLQRLTNGRFALGLGSQIKPHIERRFGATWESPLGQMREIIEALRAIFDAWQNQTPLNYKGRWTEHTLMPPTLTPAPLPVAPPPVWLAALGPKMTQLAGACADGLLVHPFTSGEHIAAHTLPNLDAGIAQAGRSPGDVTVTVGALVGIHDGSEAGAASAEGTVRAMLGFYGSTPAYRPVLETHGWGDLQPELRRLTKENRWAELGGLYDETQVKTLAIIGTPDEVGAELRHRFGDRIDRIALSLPLGVDPDALAATVHAYRNA